MMSVLLKKKINRIKQFTEEHFFKIMVTLAIPIILQNIMSSSLNFIDNIMVGRLGDTEIAAVGLANQVYFIILLFLLGVSGGASMFISQFWGKKDMRNIRRVQGLSLILSITACSIATIVSLAFPDSIIKLFSKDPNVITIGSSFLRISSLSYIMFGISTIYSVTLRNTGHPHIPMIANIIAVIVNTVLNYCLIFGNLGFPRLEVPGSAMATCLARLLECAIILTFVYSHNWPSSATIREMLDLKRGLVRRFFSQSGLLIFKDVLWATGIIIYNGIYSRIGTSDIAAVNILNPIVQISTVLFTAFATSCQIMVGNQLGMGNDATAYQYAKRFLKIGIFGGALMGITLISCRGWLLLPYNISEHTLRNATWLIMIYGIYMPLAMFNMTSVVGVMRSGGDTMICIIMDLIAVYFIGLPLALFGAFVLDLPVFIVYAMIYSQEIFKAVIMLRRFISKKWMNNLVRDII